MSGHGSLAWHFMQHEGFLYTILVQAGADRFIVGVCCEVLVQHCGCDSAFQILVQS